MHLMASQYNVAVYVLHTHSDSQHHNTPQCTMRSHSAVQVLQLSVQREAICSASFLVLSLFMDWSGSARTNSHTQFKSSSLSLKLKNCQPCRSNISQTNVVLQFKWHVMVCHGFWVVSCQRSDKWDCWQSVKLFNWYLLIDDDASQSLKLNNEHNLEYYKKISFQSAVKGVIRECSVLG